MRSGSAAAAALISVVILGLAAAQQSPRIQVAAEEVAVNVRFTDRHGKAVSDIRPDEIRIFENGKEQKLNRLFRSDEPFDVALLLDLSPSTFDIQEGIRDRSIDFVAQMPEGNRLLLVSFDSKIYIDCDWTSDLQKLMDTIEALRTNEKASGTHLYESVSLVALKKFRRSTPRKAVIVYTDGIDHGSDGFNRKKSLEIIEESGIFVYPIQYDSRAWYSRTSSPTRSTRSRNDPDYDPRYPDDRGRRYPRPEPDYEPENEPVPIPGSTPPTIGGVIVGPTSERQKARYKAQQMYNSAKDYLTNVARVSGGRYFETPTVNALETAYARIVDELSDVYTVTYIPTDKKKDGQFRRVKIDLTRPDIAALTSKGGYWAR
jgi:VWFA-related protein